MKTIRSKLVVIVTICSIFISISLVLYCRNIFDLKEKVTLIERFDDLRDNLLELRRYEKNYFLAKDLNSLGKMMLYLSKTEKACKELGTQIKNIMGTPRYDGYLLTLNHYKKTINKMISGGMPDVTPVGEDQLRIYGKELNDFTDELIKVKRERIDQTLNHMLVIPIIFSTIFLLIFIILLRLIRKDIFEPLGLLQSSTENIAKGIFEPVNISVEKCDEVSRCLNAFNKMTNEIETRQEQLLQSRKMASIGTFTSGIAHELNNPINNISLIVDGLLEDGDDMSDEERKGLYNDLMIQADRSSDIIKNLLEFSRSDHKRLEQMSLERLIDITVRLIKNELQLHQISFHKTIVEPLQPVWVDKNRLQQAFLNIMLNAIQAMPGGGNLRIALGPGKTPDEMRIDISDSGEGIPSEQLAQIFDPFFTTKKEGQGTGLGLAVTYGIIAKHGGRITVQSTPGNGSCFSIFLPAAPPQ